MATRKKIKSPLPVSAESSSNKQLLRSLVIGVTKQADEARTRSLDTDPFQGMADAKLIIPPPFDPSVLSGMPEFATDVGPAVDVMCVNVDGFGHVFVTRDGLTPPPPGDEGEAAQREVDAERLKLRNFFAYAWAEGSFRELRMRIRKDLETSGNAYLEEVVVPGQKPGQGTWTVPAHFHHLPAYTVRLTPLGDDFIPYSFPRYVLTDEGTARLEVVRSAKRFRRFVQVQDRKKVYFKEIFDPRVLDWSTGEFYPPEVSTSKVPLARRANALHHLKLYCPRSPYGLPRYIGKLFEIYGSRAANEINYVTLKSNNVPSMVLMVSNGQLSDGSINRIQEFVDTQIRGTSNYSRFLLLEAEPSGEGITDPGTVKLAIEPLSDVQRDDAMFREYTKANANSIRESWRLPPIFVGQTSDYSRATAETSRRLADEQVFDPERKNVDDWINRAILPRLGVVHLEYRSRTANITDDRDLIQVLGLAERTGALTPAIAREIVADILQRALPPVTAIDADVPFTVTIAREAKANPGGAAGATATAEGNQNTPYPGDDTSKAQVFTKLNQYLGGTVAGDLLDLARLTGDGVADDARLVKWLLTPVSGPAFEEE